MLEFSNNSVFADDGSAGIGGHVFPETDTITNGHLRRPLFKSIPIEND